MAFVDTYYPGGGVTPVLQSRYDTSAQTFTTFASNGVQTGQRAMTAQEIAQLAPVVATENGEAIRARAQAALTANANFLALGAPTNAQIVAQTQALTKECNGLIRLALNLLDSTAGT